MPSPKTRNNSALCSFQNIKTDCQLGQNERSFLHEVEDLHVSSGIEDDVDLTVNSLAADQLRHFSQYCSTCQEEANITSFCTKILAKGGGENLRKNGYFEIISPWKSVSNTVENSIFIFLPLLSVFL